MADAINIGLSAAAIAVFIRTPSHPSSIAMTASDGAPIPASTMTGFEHDEIIFLIFLDC